jgi:hypothetical protein
MATPLRSWVAIAGILLTVASACETSHVCPLTADAVETGEFIGLGEETVVFTGYVIRYVDAPDPEFRGYDVNVVRWLKGSASPEGTFLRVPREVAGISGGQPVLIIGEPAENERVIEAGPCVPLVPIADDEVDGR